MKRIIVFGLVLLLAVAFAACGASQEANETAGDSTTPTANPPLAPSAPGRGAANANVGGHEVTIDYGRPQLDGRDMLGQFQDGQSWRLGQNQATVIKIATDIQFGDTRVSAGAYSLFLKKVSSETWHLIFNSKTGQWGTDHDASLDVHEIPLSVGQSDEKVETFTIALEGGDSAGSLTVSWDTLSLSADFQIAG